MALRNSWILLAPPIWHCHTLGMKNSDQKTVEILWTASGANGAIRYYRWGTKSRRVMPVARAVAEAAIAAGEAVLGERPAWL